MIKRLYEAITGTPWTTGRSASADFGPTIAARYPELAELTDTELMAMTPAQAVAYAERVRARAQRAALIAEREQRWSEAMRQSLLDSVDA